MTGGVGCFKCKKKKGGGAFKAALTIFYRKGYIHISEQLLSGSEQLPVHMQGPLRFSAASKLSFSLKTDFGKARDEKNNCIKKRKKKTASKLELFVPLGRMGS